jgi:hypothetical protein
MTITYMQEYEEDTWLKTIMIHQIVNQDNVLIMTCRISAE